MSVNTAAAIILSSENKNQEDDNNNDNNEGQPKIGNDFYINRGVDECQSSLSSLSGGLTNLNNIRFADLDYDVEKADRGANIEDENRPAGQFDIVCGQENTNTEDKSSLSSLTNDFARKGRFFPFGRLRTFQVQLEGLSDCDDSNAPWEKKDTPVECSLWFMHGAKTRKSSIQNNATNSPSSQGTSNTPQEADGSPWFSAESRRNSIRHDATSSPSSQGTGTALKGVAISVPEKDLFASKKHLDELVRYPPPSAFLPASHRRRVTDLDSSRQAQWASDNASVSTRGFAAYITEEFNNIACRKKMAAIFVVVMFIACIIAITAAGFNFSFEQENVHEWASSHQIGKPKGNEQTIPIGDDKGNGNTLDSQSNAFSLEDLFSPEQVLTSTKSPVPSVPSFGISSSSLNNATSPTQASAGLEPMQVSSSSEPPSTVASIQNSISTVLSTQANMTDIIEDEVNVAAAPNTSTAVSATVLSTQETTNGTTALALAASEPSSAASSTALPIQEMEGDTTQLPAASETSSVVSSTVPSTQETTDETMVQTPVVSKSSSTVTSALQTAQETADVTTQAATASQIPSVPDDTTTDASAAQTPSSAFSTVASTRETTAETTQTSTAPETSSTSTTRTKTSSGPAEMTAETTQASTAPETSPTSTTQTKTSLGPAQTTTETTQASTAPETSSTSTTEAKTSSGPAQVTKSTEPSTTVSSAQTASSTAVSSTVASTQADTTEPSSTTSTSDASTAEPSASPTQKSTTSSSAPTVDQYMKYLKPKSDTSIFKNRPTKSYADSPYLAVKGLNRASSFLRFDASEIPRNFVAKAVLRLHSVVRDNDEDDDDSGSALSSVSVDVLTRAGEWDGYSVTWNNPLESTEAFRVASFSMEGYPYNTAIMGGRLQRVHEVDVTRAFRRPSNSDGLAAISLKLYSDVDSAGRVDFASSEWNGGFAEPELVIELSDTQFPTEAPVTTSPTVAMSSTPSMTPSTTPSKSETPSTSPSEASSPTPSQSSECEVECDEDGIKKFEREFGFESISEWIDDCIQTMDCGKERECKKKCERDAEKAENDALKKVEKHTTKCKEKCIVQLADGPPEPNFPSTIPSEASLHSPQSECEAKCDEVTIKEFEWEFGFASINEWIDDCIQTMDCGKDRECKKKCERDAEKAEEHALKKVEKHNTECNDECIISFANEWQFPSTSPFEESSPLSSMSSECAAQCDEITIKEFEWEFGFASMKEWVDDCIQTMDCGEERECKKKCKRDAEKAEEHALKKVEKHTTKCRDECIISLAIEWHSK